MNDAVIPELLLLAFSILAGLSCFFLYDLLLVLRAFLHKPLLLDKLEDVLYWCAASIFVFVVIYRRNNGIIRGYSIAGMLLGMLCYRLLAKEKLVQAGSRQAKRLALCKNKLLEPLKRKKMELQIKRKQSKIEKEKQKSKKPEKGAP